MRTEICKCNNCERLLIDENPQIGAEKVEGLIKSGQVKETESGIRYLKIPIL